jgi:pSer/pThr/pTyr-binding forkhead associated (FHA) protein
MLVPMVRGPVPARSATELKERIEAEREGHPFLVFHGADDAQCLLPLAERTPRIIGRGDDAEVDLGFDSEVSRTHAELQPVGSDWALVDDGLSRNGSFVNGERIVARRRLRDGDVLTLGRTEMLFRDPRARTVEETAAAVGDRARPAVTDQQRRVLIELCRPFRDGDEFATPATNKEIAERVFLSVDAVKAHLRALFERFDVADLPQNQKRVRLAELALRSGVVTARDLT